MAWEPDSQTLGQLAMLLRDSLSGYDKNAQKNAELALKEAKANPGMNNYLTYLCVHPDPIGDMTADNYQGARFAGAIMLKNNVHAFYKSIPEENKTYIRDHILEGLRDTNSQIRNYSGNVITEMVRQGGILAWSQVLPDLMSIVENSNGSSTAEAQDGAMGALLKICEDNKRALNKKYQGQRPLDAIVPKLIDFTQSPNPKVRAKALSSLNSFMKDSIPEAIQVNVENILMQLFQRAEDTNEEVRRFVCRLFTSMTDSFPQLMLPHLGGVIDYILMQQKSGLSSELALEAAEFFFENNDKPELQEAFGQHLGKIIPVLLESMVYSEEDQARLEADAEEDAENEDREQDIAPQFATSKDAIGGGAAGAEAANGKPVTNGFALEDDESDGEIDEENDYGDPEDEWNLRKCSASSLDTFATQFHNTIFEVTLPYLLQNLKQEEWPRKEAAVLALGAIAPGCMEAVQPHLPELSPYLLTLLNDQTSVVRKITCWTLGRYSSWAASLDDDGWKQYFEPIMEGMLHRMLDRNKGVQKAAVSAFVTLEDSAKDRLKDYSTVIAQQFVKCFGIYKDRNMAVLYDCIQTLADNIGSAMASEEMVNLLMPALIGRWERVQDGAREIFALHECLSYVATAMGAAFAPFAEPFFSRCIRIIQDNLEESNTAAGMPAYEQPDKDFLVTSLDLLSCMIQALEPAMSDQLVAKSSPNMFDLLSYCMRDSSNDVRQSAYALLGDAAVFVTAQLSRSLDPLLRILIQQLDLGNLQEDRDTAERVLNNACWSIGEIAMREPTAITPHINDLLQKVGNILLDTTVQSSLTENAAIAIGRMGLGNDKPLAPHLGSFAPAFIAKIQNVGWTEEKQHALQGFVNVVLDNPQGLEQCLVPFLSEIAEAKLHNVVPPQGFKELMTKYQNLIPNFDEFIASMPQHQQTALQNAYDD